MVLECLYNPHKYLSTPYLASAGTSLACCLQCCSEPAQQLRQTLRCRIVIATAFAIVSKKPNQTEDQSPLTVCERRVDIRSLEPSRRRAENTSTPSRTLLTPLYAGRKSRSTSPADPPQLSKTRARLYCCPHRFKNGSGLASHFAGWLSHVHTLLHYMVASSLAS